MTRELFISFLCAENINFSMDFRKDGSSAIYVQGAPEDIINFNGAKQKYTPYLRFSHFDEKLGMIYVRDNGYCEYQTDDWCKAKCIEYRDSFSKR